MPLRSLGNCPWCGAWMEMRKSSGVFTCPVCSCAFKHKWLTWLLTLPSAVIVGYFVGTVIPLGLLAYPIAAILVWIIPYFLGIYEITTEGRTDILPEEIDAIRPPRRKESLWFIILVLLLLLATILFFLDAMHLL